MEVMQINNLKLNDIIIESRESDHFINATQLCKAGGKRFNDWFKSDSTKEFLEELGRTLEIEIVSNIAVTPHAASEDSIKIENNSTNQKVEENLKIKLVDVKKGGIPSKQGSWIHPDAAIHLAQWISPKFSIQVSRWIRELLITGTVSIDSKKTDQELIELNNKLKLQEQELEIKNKQIENLKEDTSIDVAEESVKKVEPKEKETASEAENDEVLNEIDESNAEDAEDDGHKDRHTIEVKDYDSMSLDALTIELERLVNNEKAQAIKTHVEQINNEFKNIVK